MMMPFVVFLKQDWKYIKYKRRGYAQHSLDWRSSFAKVEGVGETVEDLREEVLEGAQVVAHRAQLIVHDITFFVDAGTARAAFTSSLRQVGNGNVAAKHVGHDEAHGRAEKGWILYLGKAGK